MSSWGVQRGQTPLAGSFEFPCWDVLVQLQGSSAKDLGGLQTYVQLWAWGCFSSAHFSSLETSSFPNRRTFFLPPASTLPSPGPSLIPEVLQLCSSSLLRNHRTANSQEQRKGSAPWLQSLFFPHSYHTSSTATACRQRRDGTGMLQG